MLILGTKIVRDVPEGMSSLWSEVNHQGQSHIIINMAFIQKRRGWAVICPWTDLVSYLFWEYQKVICCHLIHLMFKPLEAYMWIILIKYFFPDFSAQRSCASKGCTSCIKINSGQSKDKKIIVHQKLEPAISRAIISSCYLNSLVLLFDNLWCNCA